MSVEIVDWVERLPPEDIEVVKAARRHLERTRSTRLADEHRWISSVAWPAALPTDLRDRLASMADVARTMSEDSLSELFSFLARDPEVPQAGGENGTVTVLGCEGRMVRVWLSDDLLPAFSLEQMYECASDKDGLGISLPSNVSMLLHVSSTGREPRIQVPLFLKAGESLEVDLRGLVSVGTPLTLRYIPRTVSVIGGDLLGRNSLPTQTVRFGPLLVQEGPMSTREFVALGGNLGSCRYLDDALFDQGGQPRSQMVPSRGGPSDCFPVVGLDLAEVERFVGEMPSEVAGEWGLPTMYEWEALFRGPERFAYPWGDAWLPGAANVIDEDIPALEPVGSRPLDRSRWGLNDGGGNVEEWTAEDGRVFAKGGSWYNDIQIGRSASRVVRAPNYRHPKLGFRLVLRL